MTNPIRNLNDEVGSRFPLGDAREAWHDLRWAVMLRSRTSMTNRRSFFMGTVRRVSIGDVGQTASRALPRITGGGGMRVLIVGIILLVGRAAFSDSISTTVPELPSLALDFSASNPFPKGLRLVTVYGGFAEQPTGEREQLSLCNVGLNYYFWDNWAFGIEATGVLVDQDDHDSAAGGADILLRTHLINYERFSFYGDFTVGVLEADHVIPPGGTDFNFTIRTGVGAVYSFSDRVGILFGVRYLHLSNARQEGPSRNPSLNAIEGYAGFLFRM
jgi:hypothetical protein